MISLSELKPREILDKRIDNNTKYIPF
jgi:hypothetical protein